MVRRAWEYRAILAFVAVGLVNAYVAERAFEAIGQAKATAEEGKRTARVAKRAAEEVRFNAVRTVWASRQGCRRLNVVRRNQARFLLAQVKQTRATLAMDLGVLEPFRKQIIDQQRSRLQSLRESRRSVRDFPVKGEPYFVDCRRAYPLPRPRK